MGPNLSNGQIRYLAFPIINPVLIGPYVLESIEWMLSPSTQTWLTGTSTLDRVSGYRGTTRSPCLALMRFVYTFSGSIGERRNTTSSTCKLWILVTPHFHNSTWFLVWGDSGGLKVGFIDIPSIFPTDATRSDTTHATGTHDRNTRHTRSEYLASGMCCLNDDISARIHSWPHSRHQTIFFFFQASSEKSYLITNMPSVANDEFESVSGALKPLHGISNLNVDLASQKVTVKGSAPPSKVIEAIQGIGKDAIIRGTGQPNSAAVSILESFDEADKQMPVKGLARMVAVGPNEMYVDLTLSGVKKGTYYPSIRENGNIWKGALTTGKSIFDLPPIEATEADGNGYKCQEFVKVPLGITGLIGRSLVVSHEPKNVFLESLCGVIARSAGAWENDKYVCSCTGKTIWQERVDALGRGISN
ncbi:hypothetical protein OGAPHI_000748 [Ogataea philodendri]|uniref:Superoxide dismutase 1 copper chaperone n=1 Tax=Ogataea philodendri TaxID=1378263 RepID=A0A9P8PGV6_9ASCO|nr:uncharacterized protein OGAPHI_000748 [Ogataea philodendri]KAH3671037.1 hypothetical protein OGAPHI_000748 [Ogataea philodendri]